MPTLLGGYIKLLDWGVYKQGEQNLETHEQISCQREQAHKHPGMNSLQVKSFV